MSRTYRVLAALICAGSAAWSTSCAANPDEQKRAYFESGNRYAEAKKYAEAVVEYKNAVQIDPSFGEAQERLANALFETGDTSGGARALVLAADLLPGRTDIQLKAGSLLLLAGRFDDAQVRAQKVLAADPANIAAQILKANALAGLKDLEKALTEIEHAISLDPSRATSFTALGGVQVARGETAEAEAAFRKAVSLDERSVQAHLALGAFYWSRTRLAEAEAAFAIATKLEPRNPIANRAMATFLLASNRASSAEQYLVVLAEEGREASPRLGLADYYVMLRRYDEALATLEALTTDRNRGMDARLRIASVRFLQNNKAEAYRIVDEILAKDGGKAEALLTRARFLVSDAKHEEALATATRAVEADPGSAAGHYLIGVLQTHLRRYPEAHRAFSRVIEINPRAVSARVQLASLEFHRGNSGASLQHAQGALAAQPQNINARLLVARSYLSEGNVDGAERELKTLLTAYPRWPLIYADLALVHVRRGQLGPARAAYQKCLQLDPKNVEATAGLIALDVQEGKAPHARARLDAALASGTDDPQVLRMAARGFLLLKDRAKAEQLLKRVVDRDANNLQAYGDLAQLYFVEGRLDEARAAFERLAEREPRSIAAKTMVGMILQTQNRRTEAIRHYEQALAVNKQSAVAANNLAWMYAEGGENLETAVELAKTAKRALPKSAEVNDTLGFVYIKKNAPDLAIAPLREAVLQDPANQRYRARLALALARTGKADEARLELTRVGRTATSIPEVEQARAALEQPR